MTVNDLADLLAERRANGDYSPIRVTLQLTVTGEVRSVSHSGEPEVALDGNRVFRAADITGIEVTEP